MNPWKCNLQHIGISVVDLEQSIQWYAAFFGFIETKRFRKDALEISGAVLQLGNMSLEILAPFTPIHPPSPPHSLVEQLRKIGTNHIAIGVSDLSSCFDKLTDAGCSMMTPIIDGRFFFCSDPDGTVLEIRKL